MSSGGNPSGDAIAAFFLGLLGGALGAYLLKKILEDVPITCPECKRSIPGGISQCPNCGIGLEWD